MSALYGYRIPKDWDNLACVDAFLRGELTGAHEKQALRAALGDWQVREYG